MKKNYKKFSDFKKNGGKTFFMIFKTFFSGDEFIDRQFRFEPFFSYETALEAFNEELEEGRHLSGYTLINGEEEDSIECFVELWRLDMSRIKFNSLEDLALLLTSTATDNFGELVKLDTGVEDKTLAEK